MSKLILAETVYLVVADDAVVYRPANRDEAVGYGKAHAEHTGEEFEIAELEATEGGEA